MAEYDASGTLLRRFVFDPTSGQPVMEYAGSGVGSNFHHYYGADERGSIVSVTDFSGNLLGIDTYDEYGKPGAANLGRFQYTGQKWLSEIGAYDYKARVYLPHLGVFAQTDPIGQAAGPNLYAYVGGDPVNLVDPLGLQAEGDEHPEIVVVACQNGGIMAADGSCYYPAQDFGVAPTPGGTEAGGGNDIEVVHPGCRGGQFVGGVCTPSTPTPTQSLIPAAASSGQQPCFIPASYKSNPDGALVGVYQNERGNTVNTALSGDWPQARTLFQILRIGVGDTGYSFWGFLDPSGLWAFRSSTSGIQLREGFDLRPRIDIPGGALHTRRREVIHFVPADEPQYQCPSS